MTLVGVPATERTRSVRMRAPALTVAGLAAATLALHVRDPHVQHSWGVCPLYALTGIYCPGCGGLRAVNDLSNGHVGAAASSNLLFVVSVPVIVFLLGRWAWLSWQGSDGAVVPALSRRTTIAVLVVAVVFTVARNLPGSWLAP